MSATLSFPAANAAANRRLLCVEFSYCCDVA